MLPRSDIVSRVLEAVLKISSLSTSITLEDVFQLALTSRDEAQRILSLIEVEEGTKLGEDDKIKVILNALKLGVEAGPLARYLNWREFEKLTTALLNEAGYDAEWNVKLFHGGKRIQVDVLAYNGSILLMIDCKRWNKALTPSMEREIMDKQEKRLLFLKNIIEQVFGQGNLKAIYVIPITLSLYKPSKPIIDGFIFASVEKFRGALEFMERSFLQLKNEKIAVPRDFTLRQIVRRLREATRLKPC